MRRRQLLASGTALLSVAVAGCGHPDVVLDLDEATAEDIADEVSTLAEPGSEEHTVLTEAIENGTATQGGRSELFEQDERVRVEDTVYSISRTRIGGGEATVYAVRIDFDPADSTPELGEINYEDLPEADRQRLDGIIAERPESDHEGYDIGTGYGTAEEVGNGSVFVPEQEYDILVYEGDRYRIGVESRTATETEYRYEVTEIAPDIETFADQLRDRYLFALSELSEAEREVLEEAIESAYFQDDDAFRSVVDRIRDHEGIREDGFYGTWLLEYEGVEYLTYVEW